MAAPGAPTLPPGVERDLVAIVGRGAVLTDPDITTPACRDWTGRVQGATPALVRPASTAEVADVLRVCAASGVAVVPQGGNTGLVAGGVAVDGEIVLQTVRLSAVEAVDLDAAQVTAGAGATLAAVQRAAAASGLRFTVDLAARDSATIGGMVATNAGGLRVLRFGSMRRHLVGIEAVLGDGTVIRNLRGLLKDNSGYDLPGLLCGSEGTLGVVTAARLLLAPAIGTRSVALVGFATFDDLLATFAALRRRLPGLEAAEAHLAAGARLVQDAFRLPSPLAVPAAAYLTVEVTDPEPSAVELADRLARAIDEGGVGVLDAAVGTDGPTCARLWAFRERHTEAIATVGTAHKLDVTLPAGALASFVASVPEVVASIRPAATTWLFGHVGDGNIHVNITGVEAGDDAVDAAVLEHAAAMGGSISAEHGIGRLKRAWLGLTRSPAEQAAFAAVKRALDPAGILNPGVLLPPVPGATRRPGVRGPSGGGPAGPS